MSEDRSPEISFGAGRNQVTLKGSEAIKAGGWTLRLLFVAKAVAYLTTPTIVTYALIQHFIK